MKITVTQIDLSPLSLRLGCTVEYFDDGPVRFALVEVPWSLFDRDVRAQVLQRFNTLAAKHLEQEPLF